MEITLDNIIFTVEEQDFEMDGGYPVLISSIGSPQVFDSYLVVNGEELKLYRPTPHNISISWDIKLLLNREKFKTVQRLILKQTELVKEYRKSKNTKSMEGFKFIYGDAIDTKVWLSSFSNSGAFYSTLRNMDIIRCKLTVTEAE